MTLLASYGVTIAAITERLRSLIANVDPSTTVTARHPAAARTDLQGTSVNVFLYQDGLTHHRDGVDPTGESRLIGAELRYLVNVYPADELDVGAESHRIFGVARAAVEGSPVVTATLPSGATESAQLMATGLTLVDLTSLWLASGAPLRLAFGVTVRVAVTGSRSATDAIERAAAWRNS